MNKLFTLLTTTTKLTTNKKLLVIFFRGAWCIHCKKQLQDFEQHRQEFDNLNIQLLGIAPDTKFKLSLLKNFLKLGFPLVADTDFRLVDAFNLRTTYKEQSTSQPAIFFFNEKGELLHTEIAPDYDDRLSARAILDQVKPLI